MIVQAYSGSFAKKVYALAAAALPNLSSDEKIPPAKRRQIIEAAVALGINHHTARTMLYRWGRTRGVSRYRSRRGLV